MAISLKDVADAAGVSVTTVSYVLNDKGNVGEETRRRVKEVILRLGYRRKVRETGMLSFVSSYNNGPTSYIRQAAAEFGYDIDTLAFDEEDTYLKNPEVFNGIAGAIVWGGLWNPGFLEDIVKRVPTVFLGATVPTMKVDSVWVDNAGGIYSAVKHLITYGHSIIGLLNGPPKTLTTAEKRMGFERALRHAGRPVVGHMVEMPGFSEYYGVQGIRELLDREPRPTAVIMCENGLGNGAVAALKSDGVLIPEEISVITFRDDISFVEMDPPVTALRFPEMAIAREAMARIVRRIEKPDDDGRRVLIQPALVCRASVTQPSEQV